MLDLVQIRKGLADRNLREVARQIDGLHYNVIYRVSRGVSDDPSYRTVKLLSDYLEN